MELRLVLTVDDFDAAVELYRDTLGLEQLPVYAAEGGRIALLDAGRATLELIDEGQAAAIDAVEVGRRVAGPVRIAIQVPDSAALADRLVAAGAVKIAGPSETPWHDLNVRLEGPAGVQLTLFQPL
jgi:catechol 2,3-dioxygenase-like lactoylglutathione lyase family enzyme